MGDPLASWKSVSGRAAKIAFRTLTDFSDANQSEYWCTSVESLRTLARP